MAARKEIAAREQALYEAFKNEDFEKAAQIYSEDACLMPHQRDAISGRAACKALLEKIIPPLKHVVSQDMFYFELLNDTTAYTNSNVASLDAGGKPKMLFRDSLLWKKIEGEWFIHRDLFNERSMQEKPGL